MLDRRTIQVADVQAETREYPIGSDSARRRGFRTVLVVPLISAGKAIGIIAIRRIEVRPFSDKQVALLETFADQAVIAIENARLFEEVQARTDELTERTQELTETLEYQTATSDVLSVISRSPNELQPVFDTLVAAAARLCQADKAQIFRRDGTIFHMCASYGFDARYREYLIRVEILPGRGSVTGRVLLEDKTVQIVDVLADPDYTQNEPQRLGGFRTHMGVPLLREGKPIGVIVLSRTTVRAFSEKQIKLAETFADQAVIAINNVRLFEEVQARTRELTESLEQQTATADVLKVISRSALDVQKSTRCAGRVRGALVQCA